MAAGFALTTRLRIVLTLQRLGSTWVIAVAVAATPTPDAIMIAMTATMTGTVATATLTRVVMTAMKEIETTTAGTTEIGVTVAARHLGVTRQSTGGAGATREALRGAAAPVLGTSTPLPLALRLPMATATPAGDATVR